MRPFNQLGIIKSNKINFDRFISLTDDEKKILLYSLGFSIGREGFIYNNNQRVHCYYTKEPVRFHEASVLPGSTIIVKTSPINISKYIDEFLENEDQ